MIAFDRSHLEAFADLSHDRNPLHLDGQYAAKTPFGRNVVHGVASVLTALGHWAEGRRFSLRSIRAQFRRPLLLEQGYTLEVSEDGHLGTVRFLKGSVPRTEVSFEWCGWDGRPLTVVGAALQDFEPRSVAADYASVEAVGRAEKHRRFTYCPNVGAIGRLDRFGLMPDQLPLGQLSALLWASYFVGMEVPGRQALFSELSFKFSDKRVEAPSIHITDLHMDLNRGLRRLVLSGAGEGFPTFSVTAFVRPTPVVYEADQVASEVSHQPVFANRVVFISGGSRGFGAVLARSLARQGAALALNYRSQVGDAERLQRELTHTGTDCLLVPGDVAAEADCCTIAAAIRARYGGIDVLVNNASPPIEAQQFAEWTTDELMRFVSDSIRAYVQPTAALLPLVRPGGFVVIVSSVYAQEPPQGFVAYATAKSAVEGFARALARERQDVTFVTVRPPRMLTDQTNVGFELKPPRSAVGIAKALLHALANSPPGVNYRELTLS